MRFFGGLRQPSRGAVAVSSLNGEFLENPIKRWSALSARVRSFFPLSRVCESEGKRFSVAYDTIVVVLVTLAWYVFSYQRHPARPHAGWPGWFSWADQGRYLDVATSLAHGLLTADTYVYPLGYPLLGALFVRFLPSHPFFIPNVLCTLGSVLCFYWACRKVVTKIEALFLAGFLMLGSAGLTNKYLIEGLLWDNLLVIPWNVIPVLLAHYVSEESGHLWAGHGLRIVLSPAGFRLH
jgi:hypothetical protein